MNRDLLGRITRKAETIAGDQMTWDYAYDAAGRLVSSTLTTPGGSWTTTYTYDPNGNRLQKAGQFGTDTGTYDAQDRMLTYGDCTYSYTANGELSTRTCGLEVTTYQYDTFGNLTHVTMPDGITIDFVIDARNRRIGKKVNGVLVQGFLYGDQLNPVAELDGSGAVVARFVYGTKPNVPDYMVKAGITYRYITDQLGSVRLVVDAATGTIAQRIDYDEYGVVIGDTNPGFQPFGFAGGITDTHTGLIRFGARDYDPVTGRWTSKDLAGFGGGINHYLYCEDAPISVQDPSGLQLVVFPPGPFVPVPPNCTAGPWEPGDVSTRVLRVEGDWRLSGYTFPRAPLPVALPNNITPALPLPVCYCDWTLVGNIEVSERVWTYSRKVSCCCGKEFVQTGCKRVELRRRVPILYDPRHPPGARTPGVPNYSQMTCVACRSPK